MTSPDNLPTFDTSVDAPSGNGFNAAMNAIQAALSARVSTPAGIGAGEGLVWNGAGWDRSSVTRFGQSSLGSGTPDITKLLSGDGAWSKKAMHLLWDSVTAGVTLPAASITTPTLDQTFAHLIVMYQASSNVAGSPLLGLRLNGDAAAHYYSQRIQANNGAVTSPVNAAGTYMQIGLLGGTNNLAYTGSGIMLIPNYTNSAIAVPVTCISTAFTGTGTSTYLTSVASGMQGVNVGAVQTLTFIDSGGANILANSRFSVYGIGGS